MFGTSGEQLAADGNKDGVVNAADYIVWRSPVRSTRNAQPCSDPRTAVSYPNDIGSCHRHEDSILTVLVPAFAALAAPLVRDSAHHLRGIRLGGNTLAAVNLAGQDLPGPFSALRWR